MPVAAPRGRSCHRVASPGAVEDIGRFRAAFVVERLDVQPVALPVAEGVALLDLRQKAVELLFRKLFR